MSEKEKLAAAEQFVRKAMSHLSSKVSEKAIREAAREAAKCLPPFSEGKRAVGRAA